jgi:hypothetical protein
MYSLLTQYQQSVNSDSVPNSLPLIKIDSYYLKKIVYYYRLINLIKNNIMSKKINKSLNSHYLTESNY